MGTVLGVMFEGGPIESDLDRDIARLRCILALATLKKLVRVIPDVLVVTNRTDLADGARALGAEIWLSPDEFHFGTYLRQVVEQYRPEALLYLGGASAPLVTEEEFRDIVEMLASCDRVVVVNNPMSPDLIAFRPSAQLLYVPSPDADNVLGYYLKESGLVRVVLPDNPRLNFDVDTPTDFLILGHTQEGKSILGDALISLGWDDTTIRRCVEIMHTPMSEVALFGRVGPSTMSDINSHLKCRLRVFSEERGLKALGRDHRVHSLIGSILDMMGPEQFFRLLASHADCAFMDTRVYFRHWGKSPSTWDRFRSDLGDYHLISDPNLARFTEAARNAEIPVVLGGHSLVSGGIRLLVQETCAMDSPSASRT